MPLGAGARLGPYEIVVPLGAGGMGEVYRAKDPRLGRAVAIKVLPSAFSADPDRLRRFELEAQAAAALNHPNIVTIYSVEEADGTHFLTMECLEGRSLAELIPNDGMPLDRLLNVAIPLADAVSAAHHAGITHRDLKPANVMVTSGGRVKVLDFARGTGITTLGGSVFAGTRAARPSTEPRGVIGELRRPSPAVLERSTVNRWLISHRRQPNEPREPHGCGDDPRVHRASAPSGGSPASCAIVCEIRLPNRTRRLRTRPPSIAPPSYDGQTRAAEMSRRAPSRRTLRSLSNRHGIVEER